MGHCGSFWDILGDESTQRPQQSQTNVMKSEDPSDGRVLPVTILAATSELVDGQLPW